MLKSDFLQSVFLGITLALGVCCCPTAVIAQTSGETLFEKYPERAETLLDAINLQSPHLTSVKDLVSNNQQPQALDTFLSYIRNKPISKLHQPEILAPRENILKLADEATQGIFTLQSETYLQPRSENGGFDWEDLGPNQDKEWAWMMNRHLHFEFLVTSYNKTGDDRYLETLSDHLIDWIPNYPPPDRVNFSGSWRALEAARRIMDTWLIAYVYVKDKPAFSDEALFLLLTSIPEHAEYLRSHHSFWGGNHMVTEKLAIAVCATVWPEFKASKTWLSESLAVLQEELFKQTYPDGSYKELANHYQKIIAQNYLRLLKTLEGSQDIETDAPMKQRIEALWNYFAYITKPSGYGPINNDSSREDNFRYLKEANPYFQRKDWEHLFSFETNGSAPSIPPTRYFKWAGHAIMRNHWGKDAQWAFFDMGPHGSAHQHWDRLHLSISLGPDDLLVDSGRYIYVPGKTRNFFRYGVGHNVIRVDETDSIRPPNTVNHPLEVLTDINEAYDVFGASVHFELGSGPFNKERVNHQRIVLYIRDSGWIVVDELMGFGPHQYDTYWNFHPSCTLQRSGDSLSIKLAGNKFATLTPLQFPVQGEWQVAKGSETGEIRGWYSSAYNEKLPSNSARYRYSTRQPHINVWWIAQQHIGKPSIPQSSIKLTKPAQSLSDLEIQWVSGDHQRTFRWNGDTFVSNPR